LAGVILVGRWGTARLDGIVDTKIFVFSAHWSQIKFAETSVVEEGVGIDG